VLDAGNLRVYEVCFELVKPVVYFSGIKPLKSFASVALVVDTPDRDTAAGVCEC